MQEKLDKDSYFNNFKQFFFIFLGVFDAVYLSDQALLRTPFVSTAQAPEGCASYTFPRIMGRVKVLFMFFFSLLFCALFVSGLLLKQIRRTKYLSNYLVN